MGTPSWPSTDFDLRKPSPIALDLAAPTSVWRVLGRGFGLPLVLACCVVLGLNHRTSGIIGVLGTLAAVALILGIEVPLLLRMQRRREAERLRRLPAGTYFVRSAATVLAGRRAPVRGTLTVDLRAMTFASQDGESSIVLPWRAIAAVTVRPGSRFQLARLSVVQTGGASWSFTVMNGHSSLGVAIRRAVAGQTS